MRTRSLLILGSSGYWGTMGGRGPGATHVNNCLHQQLEPPQLHKTQGEDMKFLSHSPQATFIVDHLSSNISAKSVMRFCTWQLHILVHVVCLWWGWSHDPGLSDSVACLAIFRCCWHLLPPGDVVGGVRGKTFVLCWCWWCGWCQTCPGLLTLTELFPL